MIPILNGQSVLIVCVFSVDFESSDLTDTPQILGLTFQITIGGFTYPNVTLPGDQNTVYKFSVPEITPYIYSILTYTGVVTVVNRTNGVDGNNATANVQFFPYSSPLCDQAAISETNAIQIPRLAAIKISPAENFFGEIRIKFKVYDGDYFNEVGSNWCNGFDTTIPFTVTDCPVSVQPGRYSEDSKYIRLTVLPVNDKPVVDCGSVGFTFYDGCSAVSIGGGIFVSDIDSTELQWARFRIKPESGSCDLASEVSINTNIQ